MLTYGTLSPHSSFSSLLAPPGGALVVPSNDVGIARQLTQRARAYAQVLLAILGVGFPLTVFGAVTNARQAFVLNNLGRRSHGRRECRLRIRSPRIRRRAADAGVRDDGDQRRRLRRIRVER